MVCKLVMYIALATMTSPLDRYPRDVRDNLPDKSANYYRMILQSLKEKNWEKAGQAWERLKPLAEHVDRRYGGNLQAVKIHEKSAMGYMVTIIYQSVSISYDESLETLNNDDEIRKKIRYAMEEFSEIEADAKEKDHKMTLKIRRLIQQSMSVRNDKDKLRTMAKEIQKSYAKVFPEAAAYTLKTSMSAGLKDSKFKTVAKDCFTHLEETLKVKDSGKAGLIEKGISGDAAAVSSAIGALESLFPEIRN